MAQSTKLQLRQTQGLALTPQLMQSIKLLQMSALELTSFVQDEIEKNPLLELKNSISEFPEERRKQAGEKAQPKNSETTQPLELDGHSSEWNSTPQGSQKRPSDILAASRAPDSFTNSQSGGSSSSGQIEFSGRLNDLEAFVASQQSLRDNLLQQAALTFRNPGDIKIAGDIIDLIDEDGYLRDDLSILCNSTETNSESIFEVLHQIQKFDPPGVGARDLGECMRLQLQDKNRLDPAMEIFTDNLKLLAKRDYGKLARICKVSHEDLIDMAREIQELEPRPGDAFNSAPVQYVTADVFVSTNADGTWQIELNSQNLPKVLINREYYAEIKDLGLKESDRKFLIDNLQNANWLVASLDQRAKTILKVATEIVRQQDMFFVNGEEFLKPLTLKAIAEKTDLHESTISRVTRNKYLTCDRGIFEFKYFFMSGISGKNGNENIGGKSIQVKIQNLIRDETSNNVLSDENIAQQLSEDGIDIARRTVTKYRESMGIMSSIQRRRELKVRDSG